MTESNLSKRIPISFFPNTGKLRPEPAAAVILWTIGGDYLMQLRDDIPGIFYPGHYGFFGGAASEGESILACAARELREEINIDFQESEFAEFSRIDLDFGPFGYGRICRYYFEIKVEPTISADIRLSEGLRAEFLQGNRLLVRERVTPYDAFVLWQHWNVRTLDGSIKA